MKKTKDISDKRYKEITESAFTPLKFRLEWVQKTRENRPAIQLFIVKNFDQNINEYYLLIGIPFEENYLIFTHLCEQPPTFVISDICHILVNNLQNHGNNSFLINQYLNGNGYKNLEHIVTDIFTQEMTLKMEQFLKIERAMNTAVLFNDYSYLIQRSLNIVQTATNSVELSDEKAQNFFYFMLSIEDAIKKLNQEFMMLYLCFYKMTDVGWPHSQSNKNEWGPIVRDLKRSYYLKINHHINVIKLSLQNQQGHGFNMDGTNAEISDSVGLQLDALLTNLELFQQKEIYLDKNILEASVELSHGVLDPA